MRNTYHVSFYITFRLQNDLNPTIDNRWHRSWAPLLHEGIYRLIRGYRRPWSTNLHLENSHIIYIKFSSENFLLSLIFVSYELLFLSNRIKNITRQYLLLIYISLIIRRYFGDKLIKIYKIWMYKKHFEEKNIPIIFKRRMTKWHSLEIRDSPKEFTICTISLWECAPTLSL